ncbi:MAG: carbon storage regulator CsrA [Clostridium sp.]|uniref:carbon storage regulator CsrA n=1 Tax=Clostridium sp. TaxID=1506 RepID=UPI003F38A252
MLVVSRKKEQSIIIGEDIEIKVISVENGVVKLGIEAPKDVSIVRKEIIVEVENENKEASKIDLNLLKNLKIK